MRSSDNMYTFYDTTPRAEEPGSGSRRRGTIHGRGRTGTLGINVATSETERSRFSFDTSFRTIATFLFVPRQSRGMHLTAIAVSFRTVL